MAKRKKHFKGMSFIRDHYFLRNITIIFSAIFIWRGVWNLLDHYLLPMNPDLSNIISILIGIILLLIFDKELESAK